MPHQALYIISSPFTYVNSNWSYNPEIKLNWVLTSETLTFDLWLFTCTSLLSMVVTPENFMMIWWYKHSENGVADGWTDWTIHRVAWSQLTRQIWGIWKLRPAYSQETPNLGQNRWCFVPCDLKFDGWPWKTIGHLSFAASSFVQHFIAIGEFKLELQSGNAQFGSNSTIFRAV